MTEPTSPLRPPAPVVQPARRRLSLIWAVPLLAALVGLALVVQTFWQRGPVITVSFATAQGIEPGKTKVRFKDVDVGKVRMVKIAPDRSRVLVTIDLETEAREFAAADSRFWVVRPRLAGAAISGLETVLSGSYIGVDGGHSDEKKEDFVGLDEAPVVASDVPGHRFRLRADDIGSLDVGSPVYFRRIPVGHVESFSLQPDGRHIVLGVFIKAPYDRFVTSESRFWHASGVDLKVGADGLKVETQSLVSILMGGIAFETPGDQENATMTADGSEFTLAATHADAIKNPSGHPVTVMLRFRQSIRGLTIGAPVDFRGVEIGQVTWLGISYEPSTGEFVAPVTVDVYPERLAGGAPLGNENTHRQVLADLVKRGLRAQLRPGSLLTGQLYVALDFFPEAPKVQFAPKKGDQPELPTIPSNLDELQRQLQSILQKLDKLPLDELAQDAHRSMVALEASLKRMESLEKHADNELMPEIRDGLRDMRKTMDGLQQTMSPDAPLQQDSRAALQDMAAMARSLKSLTDSLDRQPESLLRGKTGDGK